MRHLPLMGGYPQYCLPQNYRLGGNPKVGNFELVHHQDCLPYFFIFGGLYSIPVSFGLAVLFI